MISALGTMRQRIREAVVRIAKMDDNLVASLPFFEKSLLPILSLAAVVYSATSFVRRRLYQYGLFRPVRYIPSIIVVYLVLGVVVRV